MCTACVPGAIRKWFQIQRKCIELPQDCWDLRSDPLQEQWVLCKHHFFNIFAVNPERVVEEKPPRVREIQESMAQRAGQFELRAAQVKRSTSSGLLTGKLTLTAQRAGI